MSRNRSLVLLPILLAACAMGPEREVEGPPRKENIVAVTEGGSLVRFNAGQPQKVTTIGAVKGLQADENLMGIDYRVSRGVLFGLGSSGRIYTIDAKTAEAKAVGTARLAIPLAGGEFGFDFNPAVDRIRIVSNSGQNMRAHPDTGASVDGNPNQEGVQPDGPLAYAAGDRNAGTVPRVVGAGYTYNKQNDKITTNYAIDAATGSLVMQGSKEGATPAVSPNTGQLFTVGSLGVAPFGRASFDISDVSNAAFVAINHDGAASTRFYLVDLESGKATFIGTVGGGRLRGVAIEP
jgi:DNA-binding beta-propeller fold protein YncE